jgi:hydroxymethylpyrimidine/phosphomethylpyrimidine kinase
MPVVFDPVMVASSGHKLIEDETVQAIIDNLFPIADLITPNMDEAAVLADMKIETVADMYVAGEKIKALGARNILLKGGHLRTEQLTSLFFAEDGTVGEFYSRRYATNNTHGSGCTLSSAIASYLAQDKPLAKAIALGQEYIQQAIYHGRNVVTGKGNGPLNHFFKPQKLIKK